MYDIINDAIILSAVCFILAAFFKRHYTASIVCAVCSYCCLPVAKFGAVTVNPAYFVTLALFVIFIRIRSKGFRLNFYEKLYVYFMTAALVFSAIGWMTCGKPSVSGLASFAGAAQYMFGALFVCFIVRYFRSFLSVRRTFYISAGIITFVNFAFALFQLLFYKAALAVTYQLFVSPQRVGPINSAIAQQRFSRAFGSNYTPIYLGLVSLCIAAFILGDIIKHRKNSPLRAVFFFFSACAGLMALSKTIIIGIMILLGLFILTMLLTCKQYGFKRTAAKTLLYLALTATAFSAVYALGAAVGIRDVVDHYYSSLIHPAESLGSRYDGIFHDDGTSDALDGDENVGITFNAYAVFEKHPAFGVGPQAVEGEFLGDSQFIIVLHDGGVTMFLCYGILFLWLFFAALLHKRYLSVFLLTALGAGCLSIPALYSACTIPFLALTLMQISFSDQPAKRQDGKIHVCEVIPAPGTGGAERLVEELCRSFDKDRFEITLVSLYGSDGSSAEFDPFRAAGVSNIVCLNKKRGFDIITIRRFSAFLRKTMPDVIHTHLYACIYALFAVHEVKVGAKLVHTVHNMAQKELPRIHRAIMKRAYKCRAVTPVSISETVTDSIKSIYRIDGFDEVLNGVNTDAIMQKKSLPQNEVFSFICAARFSPQKNHPLLISAFADALKQNSAIHLYLAGDGEGRPFAEELCRQLSIDDKVSFLGTVNDLNKTLCNYDCFVLSSDYEGLPVSVLEALSAALPVITTNAGGVGEAIEHLVNGIIVPVGDRAALCDAMLSVSLDSDKARKLGMAGAVRAKDFDIGITAKKYEEIFVSVL